MLLHIHISNEYRIGEGETKAVGIARSLSIRADSSIYFF
jgi:hypothetical protein